MLSKIIRVLVRWIKIALNRVRCIYIQSKYPGCDLTGTQFGRGCEIFCTDASTLILRNCEIADGVIIAAKHGGELIINDAFIGKNTVIVACESIKIGSFCQIAEMVVIRDHNHIFTDPTMPIGHQGLETKPIVIGENVWLGAKVTVLAGSIICDHVVIGAHSLVNSLLDSGVVYAGIPAKKIKVIKSKV